MANSESKKLKSTGASRVGSMNHVGIVNGSMDQ